MQLQFKKKTQFFHRWDYDLRIVNFKTIQMFIFLQCTECTLRRKFKLSSITLTPISRSLKIETRLVSIEKCQELLKARLCDSVSYTAIYKLFTR